MSLCLRTSKQRPVRRYGSEKSIAFARSSVAVIEEMIIISSMTATEERAKAIDFSEPYLRTGLCLLVRKQSDIQSAADLDRAGRTVAVKKGTTGHLYAAKNLRNAKTLVLDKEGSAVVEVVQ